MTVASSTYIYIYIYICTVRGHSVHKNAKQKRSQFSSLWSSAIQPYGWGQRLPHPFLKIYSMIFPRKENFSDSKMAADENVFRRSILDIVGEVLRDLQASMTERALFRLDWLLDVVNRYADSLGFKSVDGPARLLQFAYRLVLKPL